MTTTHRQETILYPGRNDDQHHGGRCCLNFDEGAAKFSYGMETCQPMYARFKGKQVNMSILQQTMQKMTKKESFYSTFQSEDEKISRHELLIIVGDLNAKVGSENAGHGRTRVNMDVGL